VPWDDPVALKELHRTNLYEDYVERKDCLFYLVTVLFNEKPAVFKALLKKISAFKNKKADESRFSLSGYLHYVNGDYRDARDCFMRAIALNPDNLDNWFDLAFALRHSGEYRCSDAILFYYELVQHYYSKMRLQGNAWDDLRTLLLKISQVAQKNKF